MNGRRCHSNYNKANLESSEMVVSDKRDSFSRKNVANEAEVRKCTL